MRMPLLFLHIAAGTVGLLSGFVAVFLRKGSLRHGVAGDVFVIAMLTMAGAAVPLAIMRSQPGNILGGTFTLYLVSTAWIAAKRREAKTNFFDWAALMVGLAVAGIEITWGLQAAFSPSGLKYDYPPAPFLIMGGVAVVATAGDLRMLVRGGISGSARIARHLWRMCFALFVASASVFLARQRLFPAVLRKTGVLLLLSFLPLLLMIFWLIRVRFAKTYKKRPQPESEYLAEFREFRVKNLPQRSPRTPILAVSGISAKNSKQDIFPA